MLSRFSAQRAGWWMALLLAAVCIVVLQVPTSVAQDSKTGPTMTLSGCLQKGSESSGYTLTAANGKLWELSGSAKILAAHVGHKVSVTGHEVHHTEQQETKMEKDEKKESEGKPYGDVQVTAVKMISTSCQ